jgi:shikimate kinase
VDRVASVTENEINKLALIGYRGTGKSTVARFVASQLGWSWIDADVELERRAGRTIQAIFATEGEAAFRDQESQVLRDLLSVSHQVVALGGGVILRATNREQLAHSQAAIVWLQAGPETIYQRLLGDPTTAARRPQLTSRGGIEEITQLLAQRAPLYQQCADVEFDTENVTPEQVAEQIVAWWRQRQPHRN